MRKEIVVIGTMLLAATLLGIKGQSIAYFVTDFCIINETRAHKSAVTAHPTS